VKRYKLTPPAAPRRIGRTGRPIKAEISAILSMLPTSPTTMPQAAEFIDVTKTYHVGLLGRDERRPSAASVSRSKPARSLASWAKPRRQNDTGQAAPLTGVFRPVARSFRLGSRWRACDIGPGRLVHENHAFPKYRRRPRYWTITVALTLVPHESFANESLSCSTGRSGDRAGDAIRTFSKG